MVCTEEVDCQKMVGVSNSLLYTYIIIMIFIALSELHGNANLERCGACGKEYLRDLPLKRAFLPNHLTGRS